VEGGLVKFREIYCTGLEGLYKTNERFIILVVRHEWHLKDSYKYQRTKKGKRPATNFCTPLPQCTMPNMRV
jgi:hypothetical protein